MSLLWLFVGYFAFFDLGIGQATLKFLSESIARNDRPHAASLVRGAIRLSVMLALFACVIAVVVLLLGVESMIHISPEIRQQSTTALWLIIASLPAILLQMPLRSVALAFNRFDLVNIILGITGIIQWGGSALVLYFGGNVISVVILTSMARYAVVFAYAFVATRLLPEILSPTIPTGERIITKLMSFGGWVSISQIAGPVVALTERLFIGALLSLSWVTFYAVPNDAVIRVLIIPISLVSALFPLMSGGWSEDSRKVEVKNLYRRTLKYTYLVMLPIAIFLALFSRDILLIWLGKEFAEKSSLALTLFSVGIFVNSLAQLPSSALQALGRPDLPSKLLLVIVPLHLIFFFAMTLQYGIIGAAIAWLVRVVIEGILLLYFGHREMRAVASSNDLSFFWKGFALALAVIVGTGCGQLASFGVLARLEIFTVMVVFYGVGVWKLTLDKRDRGFLMQLRSSVFNRIARA
ncbi:MAG: flippase [Ignavibacteria bacterium]|nr:flippase [Ignavibacteria bacterium]